jgi:rubrerythrin
MENQELIKYLKIALKNEEESSKLYHDVAEQAINSEVKDFFFRLEKDEKSHFNNLMKYYQRIKEMDNLNGFVLKNEDNIEPSKSIFTDEFITEIASKKTILTAMKIAATKEKNAMEFYKECINVTDNEELKTFFHQLSTWEEGHLENILSMFEMIDKPQK